MKILNLSLLLILITSLANCKKSQTETAATSSAPSDSIAVKADTLVEPEIHKELYGLYSGDFIGKEMIKEFDGEYEGDVYYFYTL